MDVDLLPVYQTFLNHLLDKLPAKNIYTDPMMRLAYSTDASFYRYIPQVVVYADTEAEIATILSLANHLKIGVTFRASGSSLSGQACSDSVLVIPGKSFWGMQLAEGGAKIHLKPMVIGSQANRLLAPLQRKIGPDPASINTARIGGITANNSSGMCCGTKNNSYHTLADMRVMLADGVILDTRDDSSVQSFQHTHATLLNSLKDIAARIKKNPTLAEKIRHKYRLKNTTGYGINALLDFDNPIDMLTHLMIGSEGTLGFISEVTFHTVEEHPHKASALIYFDELSVCCRAVTALKLGAAVDSVELLDARSIICVGQNIQNLPDFFYQQIPLTAACLLIETQGKSEALLNQNIENINRIIEAHKASAHSGFSTDPEVTAHYWRARKGLLPIVGAARPKGTNVLTEDVVFPIEYLAEGVMKLGTLFDQYGYDEGMVMGHALEGNLHFVITPKADTAAEIERYDAFMQALVDLVVGFGGSLKGEHGTGRNIAPFVEAEWGADAYLIMREIKYLLDPNNILNPDVVITDNAQLHLENLKPMPVADELIDRCIECGFCEPACPSNGLSLTPRQRIAVWRYIQDLRLAEKNDQQKAELAHFEKQYAYQGIETCATTGMCATRCPVGINTGTLMKKLKGEATSPRASQFAAQHLNWVITGVRFGLHIAHWVGASRAHQWSQSLHKRWSVIPVLPQALPYPVSDTPIPESSTDQSVVVPRVVYFVSCVNRTIGEGTHKVSLVEHILSLFKKAGWQAVFPTTLQQLCCGQPFDSTNATNAADLSINRLNLALLEASCDGVLPIYLDNSPCALRIIEAQKQGRIAPHLKLFDAATFLQTHIVPHLNFHKKYSELALHTPCSASKMGLTETLAQLAALCSENVLQPDIACCGFAGNKGFNLPELNANGLKQLKSQLTTTCQHGVSMSRTCQIGLTTHAGFEYQSIEALLNECSVALSAD